jgi:hypothetical protein
MMIKFPAAINPAEAAKKPSLWVRNIQLAIFTLMIGIPSLVASPSFDAADPLRGFDATVLLGVVVNNASGGLMVALIVKYADNIAKGFSNAISTVLATLIAIPLFGFETTWLFGLGVVLVLTSSLIYGNVIQLGGWWDKVVFASETGARKRGSSDEELELEIKHGTPRKS